MKQKIVQAQRAQSGECAQKAKLVTVFQLMKLTLSHRMTYICIYIYIYMSRSEPFK